MLTISYVGDTCTYGQCLRVCGNEARERAEGLHLKHGSMFFG